MKPCRSIPWSLHLSSWNPERSPKPPTFPEPTGLNECSSEIILRLQIYTHLQVLECWMPNTISTYSALTEAYTQVHFDQQVTFSPFESEQDDVGRGNMNSVLWVSPLQEPLLVWSFLQQGKWCQNMANRTREIARLSKVCCIDQAGMCYYTIRIYKDVDCYWL